MTYLKFWTRVRPSVAGCWEWAGGHSLAGYAMFHTSGERWAHRVAFRLWGGVIPAGLELDHTCRNRGCVNPAHLEAVTHQVNTQRRLVAETCPLGHNRWTYRRGARRGERECLDCKRINEQRRRDVARQA